MNPTSITIDLNLDPYLVRHIGYDADGEPIEEPQTIEDVILERAAVLFVAQAVNAEKQGYNTLRDRVSRISDEEIRARVTPLVEEAMTTPFRRTNTYGEPTGEATTLRDQIVKVAQDYLSKPADHYSRDKGTVVQQFIAAEVKKAIAAELKDALAAAKTEVAAAVKNHAAAMIQKTIADLAGVR